jgi:hypothetical protein
MSELNASQLSNLRSIVEIAEDFSKDAGINFTDVTLDKGISVLESGHQPNFLSHSGLWKKMSLLDEHKNIYNFKSKNPITLFGFADYNLCTARLLTQNKLPAYNKLGYEKFGFKIADEDIWKRFDHLKKPDETDWENTINRILSHYKKFTISSDVEIRLTEIIEILEDCYEKAKNFPDINAFFISKICNKLGMDIKFFRYSDLQRKGVFMEQWEEIILNLEQYNNIYNNSIKYHILDIPLCVPDSLPFWYHCTCGAKVKLLLKGEYAAGRCRLCDMEHEIHIDKLPETFGDMSPDAVARNIIFSEGMGTRMFVSGVGGGLSYGRISDDLSKKLGFNLPVTISWKSRDYYAGPAHAVALDQLRKICGINKEDVSTIDINKVIQDKKNFLEKKLRDASETGNKKEIKKYEGEYRNICTSAAIIKAVFTTKPSFVDILVSQGIEKIGQCWHRALQENREEVVFVKDIIYDVEASKIYKKIEEIS